VTVSAFPWAELPVADRATDLAAAWVDVLAGLDLGVISGLRWLGPVRSVAIAHPVPIAMRVDGARATIVLPSSVAIAVADALLDRRVELPAPRVASATEQALAALAVAMAIERSGVATSATVAVEPLVADGLWVEVAIARPIAAVAALRLPKGALPGPPPRPIGQLLAMRGDRLPRLRAVIEVAQATVAVDRLLGLSPRDVVVVGASMPRLVVARGWFPVRLDAGGDRFTVHGPFTLESSMDHREQLPGYLRVPLTIVIGDVDVSARALLEMGPGQIITLTKPPGTSVELRAAGTTIARGELIVVDGNLGVRVTDVLSPPPLP
jgi:Type III flagellar switch regulator (C-ring) FliN C-term